MVLNPIKVIIRILSKLFLSHSNQSKRTLFNKIEKHANGSFSETTWTAALIEYSVKHNIFLRIILWLSIPILIALDIGRMAAVLVFEFVLSIVLYLIRVLVFLKGILATITKSILALSDRNVIAISFRIAVILGLGGAVVLNEYYSFLQNKETATIFEFVSSTVIIPVILEWILSYKTNANNRVIEKSTNNE